MKLRIRGNSIRLRLDQRDLEQLHAQGRIEEGIRFGADPNLQFSYAMLIDGRSSGEPEVDYQGGHFVIRISSASALAWQAPDCVGFESQQQFGETTVRLLIEKDFACLDRPVGEEADDAFAFPNPSAGGCLINPPQE